MHSSTRIKPMISTPKEESYRGYRVSPPMTDHYGSEEVYTQQRSLPTYRRSPSNGESSENIHYIQRNVNAPGYYKNKKPGEMSDIYENERILDLNYSDSTPYAARSYNYYNNPHDDPRSGIPVLSTRAPSNRDEQFSDSTEMNDFTQRGTPTTRRVINNTYFMAEKVYSMKIRSQGIMASLVPLGKSRNLNQTAKYSSTKGTAPARSHLDLRDSEEYTAYLESSSLRLGNTSLVEGTSRNRNILQKTLGTNSRKFLGNVNKEMSGLQSPTLKRGNSCKKITKSPIRSTPNNQQSQKDKYLNGSQVMSYGLLNSQKKERSLNALQAKLDTFFIKIDTTMWQICQRNKRIVFVLILEKLHQHKLKVTQYLERKTIILKSKSFARWKKMLSDIRQEKEEQLKSHHAMEFYNRKLTKKTFRILRTLDNSELKIIPKRSTSTKSNKQNKTPRSPSMSLLKPVLPQNNYITPRNASQPRVATPQNKTKPTLERVKSIEKSTEKKSYRPTTPKKEYSLTPVKSKSSETSTSTSTSQKKPFVPISSRTSSMTQLAKSESEITETPAFQRNQIRFPTFGKAANYYEPSEIQELTELSQSPQKRPSSPAFQNSGLDQSFGCENLDQASPTIQGGFDTILAEILQASNAHQEPESALSIIPQPIKKDELVLVLPKLDIKQEPATKYSKRKNLAQKTPIYSTIRSARDYSSPREKDFSRSYSLSARLKQEAKTTKASDKSKSSFSGLNKSCLVSQTKLKDDMESEKIKNERAISFRNKKLCQKALENLMCGNNNSDSDSQDLQNDSDEKIKKAETHYYNNLKIKILSGLLENYVHAYKDKERCKKHYEENLLKRTFSVWSSSITKTRNDTQNEEDQVSEATYNEIVKRFRYIVLTEKAMYHWKNFHRELKQNKDN